MFKTFHHQGGKYGDLCPKSFVFVRTPWFSSFSCVTTKLYILLLVGWIGGHYLENTFAMEISLLAVSSNITFLRQDCAVKLG